MDASIRTATPADLAAIGAVFRRASLSNDGDRDNLLSRPELLDYDGTWVAQGLTRVAVTDGRIVGFATARPIDGEAAELEDLFVDPDSRRRGIGRALIADAAVTVRAGGRTRIEVAANPHAAAFYDAAGFVADGEVELLFGPAPHMHLDVG